MSRKPFKRPCRDGYIAEQPTEQVNGGGGIYVMVSSTIIKLLHLEMLLPHSGVGGVYHRSRKANQERRDRTFHLDWWEDFETVRPAKRLGTEATRGPTAGHTRCLIKPDRKTAPTKMSHVPTMAPHFK